MSVAKALLAQLPRTTWVAFALLLVGLTILNMSYQADATRELGPTTYGRAGHGFGALYDLLDELGLPVARSRARYETVAPDATLWLVESALSAPLDMDGEESLRGPPSDLLTPLQSFIAAGGTAVVLGGDTAVWRAFGMMLDSRDAKPARASGPLLAKSDTLDIATRRVFVETAEDEVLLRIDGAPFALLRRYGAGHLVAVADAEPFTNGELAEHGHAALAARLARAFGAPLFDERSHGLLTDASLTGALGGPRIALLCSACGLLVLLALWSARRIPRAELAASPLPDPNLGQFVDALAAAYTRKGAREANAAYAAYVHGFRQRLRKALYGRARGSDEQLAQRLARELADDPALLAQLSGEAEVGSAADLERTAANLERYLDRQLWQSRQQRLLRSPLKGRA
jgi:hypothetical protein